MPFHPVRIVPFTIRLWFGILALLDVLDGASKQLTLLFRCHPEFPLGVYQPYAWMTCIRSHLGIIVGDLCPGSSESDTTILHGLQLQHQPDLYKFLNSAPIDIWLTHKPPTRFPRFPYNGLVTFDQRPRFAFVIASLDDFV